MSEGVSEAPAWQGLALMLSSCRVFSAFSSQEALRAAGAQEVEEDTPLPFPTSFISTAFIEHLLYAWCAKEVISVLRPEVQAKSGREGPAR